MSHSNFVFGIVFLLPLWRLDSRHGLVFSRPRDLSRRFFLCTSDVHDQCSFLSSCICSCVNICSCIAVFQDTEFRVPLKRFLSRTTVGSRVKRFVSPLLLFTSHVHLFRYPIVQAFGIGRVHLVQFWHGFLLPTQTNTCFFQTRWYDIKTPLNIHGAKRDEYNEGVAVIILACVGAGQGWVLATQCWTTCGFPTGSHGIMSPQCGRYIMHRGIHLEYFEPVKSMNQKKHILKRKRESN